MMREILFRGKSEYNGEWIFGSLHIERGETDRNGKTNIDYRILGMRGECDYVISETVGQFTGLTDKNDKRIFEGDIVRSFSSGKEHIGVVNWNKLFSSWHIGEYATLYGSENFSDNEVIGNIHDNPEVLEAD